MKKSYRILEEVDRNGNTLESVAIMDVDSNEIIDWSSNIIDAVEKIENDLDGRLEVENGE